MSNSFQFDLPTHHKSIIKVIGVGGGGSNAVTHMFNLGIKDVEFVIVNTDVQALKSSPVPNKLQIGVGLTEGLGAGANPEVGQKAALENKEDIRDFLSQDTKMVFITAGMGGGTGTGAAPVIAAVARELNVLTVGIVTAPFGFEGRRKAEFARKGIEELKQYCDTVLVISNDKLREVYGNLAIREAFSKADNVLTTAAKAIAEIITETSQVNVDFQDVQTIMKNSGPAVMGSSVAEGENRARVAVEEAISSPLLDNTDVRGAEKILLSIMYGDDQELTMDELSDITDYIEDKVGCSPENLIFGQGVDPELGRALRITVVATGFDERERQAQQDNTKTVFSLNSGSAQQVSNQAPINTFRNPQSNTQVNVESHNVQQPQNQGNVYRNQEPQQERFDLYDNTPKEQSQVNIEPVNYQPPVDNSRQEVSNDAPQEESGKVIFKIDGDYEVNEIEPTESRSNDVTGTTVYPDQEPSQPVRPSFDPDAEERKRVLQNQAEERAKRLKNQGGFQNMEPEDFKERLEVPAYKRRRVPLRDIPHSSEKEVSKYNLNDDNEIMGDNKFLHDNVD